MPKSKKEIELDLHLQEYNEIEFNKEDYQDKIKDLENTNYQQSQKNQYATDTGKQITQTTKSKKIANSKCNKEYDPKTKKQENLFCKCTIEQYLGNKLGEKSNCDLSEKARQKRQDKLKQNLVLAEKDFKRKEREIKIKFKKLRNESL